MMGFLGYRKQKEFKQNPTTNGYIEVVQVSSDRTNGAGNHIILMTELHVQQLQQKIKK